MLLLKKPICFIEDEITNTTSRIDAHYFNPSYYELITLLQNISKNNNQMILDSFDNILFKKIKLNPTGGATPKGATYVDDGIVFLRVQNVRENTLVLDDVKYIEKRIHEGQLKRSQLKPSDVLLTITGVTYGLSSIIPENFPDANINQHIVRIRVNTDIVLPSYVMYFLNSKFGKIQMDRNVTGSTRPALDYKAIKQLVILYPKELSTQESIVKEIQTIESIGFEKIRESNALEKQYDDIFLKELDIQIPSEPTVKTFQIDSIDDRFEVKWYYPYYEKIMKLMEEQNVVPINEFKHKLKYGASIDADHFNDVPFLRINNLTKFGFDLSDIQYISGEIHRKEIERLTLHYDDILIARSGSVGLCGLVSSDLVGYVYGSYMIRLRLSEQEKTRILPQYLALYLNSIFGKIQFDKLKTGALQYNINMQQIKEIKVIVPPIPKQGQIIKKIINLTEQSKQLRDEGLTKLKKAKELFLMKIS